jgi:hypothetical protein
MAVILSGDFHSGGFGEAEVLKTKYLGGFCSLHGIKLPDIHYHIIPGDGGALWPNSKESDYWFEWLSMKPFITLVLPGNHEPYPVIYDEQRKVPCAAAGITGASNASLYKVYDNAFYFRRNCEYRIEGMKLLVLGGALSIDQDMREPYESWWPEELLSPQEEQELLSSTKGKTYDAVLAHTAPFSQLPDIFENRNFNDSGYPVDPTTQIYDRLIESVGCRDWYFGHFHRNKDKTIKGISYHCLYKRIMLLK